MVASAAGASGRIVLAGATWNPSGIPILSAFSVEIALGQRLAIVGRSGCGKSSLLRVLAGLLPVDSGSVAGVPVERSFVFQDPALLPWLTVAQNVELPRSLGGRAGAASETLRWVGLSDQSEKLPAALSGGQRMRVSLARALFSEPEILFLDEPFAALDVRTRREMHDLVLAKSIGRTVILVTHDLADAARLADRVLLVDGPPLSVMIDLTVPFSHPRSPHQIASVVAQVEEATAALADG